MRVVVVGAGLGGLSAAAHLCAAGHDEQRERTPEFAELMRFEIARCRDLYDSADLAR